MEKVSLGFAALLATVLLTTGATGAETSGEPRLLLAEAIVTGHCLDQRITVIDGTPMTLVRFAVDKTLKGKVPAEITVVLPGGIYRPGKIAVEAGVEGTVTLAPQEQALLFLDPTTDVAAGYSVAVSPLGKFHIRTDPEGKKNVDRLFTGPAPRGGAPLAELEKQILEALAGGGTGGMKTGQRR